MAETADVIRTQIGHTRERLDHHLDQLGAQVEVKKDQMATSAQYWGGITAVAAGAIGAIALYPRRQRRRAGF